MIKNPLLDLNLRKQIKFVLFSMGRVHNLYELFSKEINEHQLTHLHNYLEGEITLIRIYYDLRMFDPNFEDDIVETYIKQSYALAIRSDVHSSYQSRIATHVALLFASSLEFVISEKLNLLEDILLYISEIIKEIETVKFNTTHPQGDSEKCEIAIQYALKKEAINQCRVLAEIDEKDISVLIAENQLVLVDPNRAFASV